MGEGMISSESRMRENRMSGLMNGGLETQLRAYGLRPVFRKGQSCHHNPNAGAPALDSTLDRLNDKKSNLFKQEFESILLERSEV